MTTATNPTFPFHGVPTDVDVKRLETAFPTLTPGMTITHSEIEAVIDVLHHTPRYRTIVTAWRRRLSTLMNVDMEARVGIGFTVLEVRDRVVNSARDFKRSVKQMSKAVTRIDRAPLHELPEDEQHRATHTKWVMQKTLGETKKAVKEVAISLGNGLTAQPQHPRLKK